MATTPIISIRGGGRDSSVTQTRASVAKEEGEIDEDIDSEEKVQEDLLVFTDDDYKLILGDGEDTYLQPSTAHQNDSIMSDVHPNDLRKEMEAVQEEDLDEYTRERHILEDIFGKMVVEESQNMDISRSTGTDEELKMPASRSTNRSSMRKVERMPVQQERADVKPETWKQLII